MASQGLNWAKVDAWRRHPLLTNTMKYSVPGIGVGFAAFVAYVAYDQTAGRMMRGKQTKAH
jgi:NADH dehydrogenase (ubiquinone) 1 beta subcomplex subunit 3